LEIKFGTLFPIEISPRSPRILNYSKRFQVKIGLTEMCPYKLIVIPIANPGELYLEQGVHHYDLQSFIYNMVDMHNQTLKIEEVMTSTTWLTDKQLSAKRAKSEIWVM
jgi:hypothetical protein